MLTKYFICLESGVWETSVSSCNYKRLINISGTFGTLPGCEFDKECDRDGNFPKMECVGGTCMCTDPRTGEVRRETSGPSGTFTCNEKGEKILIILRDKTKCEVDIMVF